MNSRQLTLKRFCAAAALAVGISFVVHAQSQPGFEPPHGMMPPHGAHDMAPPPGGEGMLPPYLHGIKLTEVQEDKIFAIVHAQAPQMREQAKALKKVREQMKELALADQYDEARAKALADAAAQAMSQMSLLRLRGDRQILAVLTPEQRQSLNGNNFR